MSKNQDYIPTTDQKFNSWQKILNKEVNANKAAWGIPNSAVNKLTAPKNRWDNSWDAYKAPGTRARTDTASKIEAKRLYIAVIRPFVQSHIRRNDKIKSSILVRLGLPVPDKIPTRKQIPTRAPNGSVVQFDRQIHKIKVKDVEQPKFSGIPNGVDHIHIRRFIGDEPPLDPEKWPFYKVSSRARFKSEFKVTDAGNKAHYMVRYVSTTGQMGLWSRPFSAYIV